MPLKSNAITQGPTRAPARAMLKAIGFTDEALRKQDYVTAQNIIMENALALPMFTVNTSYLVAPTVVGFTFDLEGYPWLYDLALAP